MKVRVGFGRVFWPSLVAAIVASLIGLVMFFLFLSGLIGDIGSKDTLGLNDNSILHLKLNGEVSERSSSKFDPTTFQMQNKFGLADILNGLEIASKDDQVKGVFIEIDGLSCGYSNAREIRKAIDAFEKTGKFAIAYNSGEVVTQKEYYLSSAANKVYGFPTSAMELTGLGTEFTFFKNTLQKLEVEMQVIRGKNNDFKSAVEPFFLDKVSDSSRLQYTELFNGTWSEVAGDIAISRKIKIDKINEIAQGLLIHRMGDAVKYNLIDATKYRDEVLEEMAKLANTKSIDELNLVSFEKYAKKKVFQEQILTKADEPNVAVILAEGGISVDGNEMTSKDICSLLREARMNKSIKTVVLRINSPGGSALASDEIWREVKLTNQKKKVIVSMGDVAASGGYYIAAPASTIFAEPSTITGSIGVFGVIPYTGAMFENKLGLTFDRIYTHRPGFSANRKLTAEEFGIIQEEVDAIYDDFLSRVAEGRGMTKEKVNAIARGRVWTGKDAKRIGLVDQLGGLQDAIAFAAKGAGINSENIKTLYYPLKKEDKLSMILESLEDDKAIESKTQLPEALIKSYQLLQKLEQYQGMQMRLPFDFIVK
ncbi:MAG: signal peptide peptidase SppA [Bacteroidetes bacterium]|nr:signal peptide peptidase SppA [Bacteroidota bacterium]